MAEKFPYADIVDLPHHVSKKYPQPTIADRAARFSPFAAITGYEEMVLEEARTTDEFLELDEGTKSVLNAKLQMVQELLPEQTEITFTYFQPDKRKAGGAYVTKTGTVKRIDEYEQLVIMTDGLKIPINYIFEIESERIRIDYHAE